MAGYANIVKLYMQNYFNVQDLRYKIKPIIKTKFKKLQETGLEAELFFQNNYNSVDIFQGGKIEDARLYGDGYDYQNDYIIAVVLNLNATPKILTIENPVKNLRFTEGVISSKEVKEYHLIDMVG